MKTIDITIDFETCSLDPNAAVLQMAAVVWDRHASEVACSPETSISPFEFNIDLRSCVAAGMSFDQATIDWWSRQSDEAKQNVLDGDCYPVKDVLSNFLQWVQDVKEVSQCDTICLWSQGSDFDMSILRNIASKFGMSEQLAKLVPYTCFRDARTYILELGAIAFGQDTFGNPDTPSRDLYRLLPHYEGEGCVHSALYDCMRTSWNLWTIMSKMRGDSERTISTINSLRATCDDLTAKYNQVNAAYNLMQNNKSED